MEQRTLLIFTTAHDKLKEELDELIVNGKTIVSVIRVSSWARSQFDNMDYATYLIVYNL